MLDLLNEVSNETSELLFLALLGASGAGKSHVAGTAPGKILYLHGSAESHGVTSAKKSGGDVLPVCFDRDKTGALKPDAAYKRILAVLDSKVLKAAQITSVVFDGLTELEKLIRETELFKNRCTTARGGYDKFAEVPTTVSMMDAVFNALREAQASAGVHIIVLGIIDVQSADAATGEVEIANPRLLGYGVAVTAIQQFGDILVIGKMRKGDGSEGRVFQTGTSVNKISKAAEKDGGAIKKFINFDCRLQMPPGVALPPRIKADLGEIIKLKTGVTK